MKKYQPNTSFKTIFGTTMVAAALMLSACSGTTNPDVKARQDIMKNYGDAMGIMGGMAKEPETFNAEVFKEQAAYIAGAAASPWSHFDDPEAVGKAKPAVWSNKEDFMAKAESYQQATAELNTVAQSATSLDEVMPAFSEVGASCKSCHTDYQVKDN